MQTDLYTKAVLTVIALALSAIAIQLTTKDAHAQQGGFRFIQNGALMVTECDPEKGDGYVVYCRGLNGNVVRTLATR
jgi:hypothetical protein